MGAPELRKLDISIDVIKNALATEESEEMIMASTLTEWNATTLINPTANIFMGPMGQMSSNGDAQDVRVGRKEYSSDGLPQ